MSEFQPSSRSPAKFYQKEPLSAIRCFKLFDLASPRGDSNEIENEWNMKLNFLQKYKMPYNLLFLNKLLDIYHNHIHFLKKDNIIENIY